MDKCKLMTERLENREDARYGIIAPIPHTTYMACLAATANCCNRWTALNIQLLMRQCTLLQQVEGCNEDVGGGRMDRMCKYLKEHRIIDDNELYDGDHDNYGD